MVKVDVKIKHDKHLGTDIVVIFLKKVIAQ
jgi:hypothetical protein